MRKIILGLSGALICAQCIWAGGEVGDDLTPDKPYYIVSIDNEIVDPRPDKPFDPEVPELVKTLPITHLDPFHKNNFQKILGGKPLAEKEAFVQLVESIAGSVDIHPHDYLTYLALIDYFGTIDKAQKAFERVPISEKNNPRSMAKVLGLHVFQNFLVVHVPTLEAQCLPILGTS